MNKLLFTVVLLIIELSLFGQQNEVNSSVTFPILSVVKPQSNLIETTYKNAIEIRTNAIIESYPISQKNVKLVATDVHAFISTLHISFAQHRPIVISPDMIWLLIMQGASLHIQENKDSLKRKLVNFENSKEFKVRRDSFIKGSETNDWAGVLPQFSDSIKKYMNDSLYNLFVPSFSTTTLKEKNAFEVALMSAVSGYFRYSTATFCGIPEITLEGTTDDWRWIANNCSKLNDIGLSDWTKNLQPILDEFVSASQGEVDTLFWQSMYKWSGDSGGPHITGWVIKFFPYIYKDNVLIKNEYIHGDRLAYSGLKSNSFPSGLSKVNMEWLVLETGLWKKYNMEFYSGFIGISQDTLSKALKPEISWAIRDVNTGKYKKRKVETLLDTLYLSYDENGISLRVMELRKMHYAMSYNGLADKLIKPNLFPDKCDNYEQSSLFLNKYISECLGKRVQFNGVVSFNVTWYGEIDKVRIVKSNREEYNNQIISIIDEISGCKPGYYLGKLYNFELLVQLNIK